MLVLTRHSKEMLEQRNIPETLVYTAVEKIDENNNKWLRIIVNVQEEPKKIVTAFFDRRLRRKA